MKKSWVYLVLLVALVGYCGPSNSDNNSGELNSTTSGLIPTQISSQSPSPSTVETETATSSAPVTSLQPEASPTTASEQSVVLTQLLNLAIKGRAPKTGYDRDLYGSAWSDVDRNGCDTRNDILLRDLTNVIFRSGTGNCVVESGWFYDPYTNTEFEFVKTSSGSSIEIDHIVSLSDSWQKGAQQWDAQTRKQFANDPLNLVSTSRSANRSKSDSDAASWLPPNKQIRCAFIARQVAVKSAYQLWVTQAEFDAMKNILSSCPNQELASSGSLRP